MDHFSQVLKDMDEWDTLQHRKQRANSANEKLFPALVISLVALPIVIAVMKIRATWAVFTIPAIVALVMVILLICVKIWTAREKTLRADIKSHVADVLSLDLTQRVPERKDTLKENRGV